MNDLSTANDSEADAPWLRNQFWASRRIPDQSVENLLVLWIFGIVWSIASIYYVRPEIENAVKGHAPFLLALVFPLIGLGIVLRAGWRTARIIKFGPSVFHLETLPAMPGGNLAGTIHVAQAVAAKGRVKLRLRCMQMVARGSRGRTRTTSIWETSQTVERLPEYREGTDIPVLFQIPSDAIPSGDADGMGGICWRLEASCRTAGVNYYSWFNVPVFFVTGLENVPAPAPQDLTPHRATLTPASKSKLNEHGIICEPIPGSGLRISFAAGRDKSAIFAPTLIGLLFITIAGMLVFMVEGMFRIIAISVASILVCPGVLLGWIAIYNWLVRKEITIRHGSLTLDRRAPLFHRQQVLALAEISGIVVKVDSRMSSGSGGNVKEKITYGISLTTGGGKTIWLANEIFHKEYAEWLADDIKDIVGVSGR